ncbi:MAG TPA: glycine cleavage system aminomethyltransferase GcvT [Candidatus Wallbacteria bacterium]|nr:MAG: Aminomethyltransferase [bacterium ADurb.Bin243]HPG57098.1 glycine cleavage system aminomethyltransferase GcvT [Candidatus Wallbacteria bacterium]
MVDSSSLKKTPFYDAHVKHGGKIVDFSGWLLPVQFKGMSEEHNFVRTSCGLFDVSHMGEFMVEGADALKFVDHLITNDASKLNVNQVLYTPMCRENAGVVDDLLVYKYSDVKFFLVVNAANIDKDFAWCNEVKNKMKADISLKNLSDGYAQLAIQGPKAESILQKLTSVNLSQIKFYWFCEGEVDGTHCIISRTGYTGEDGFELYFKPSEGLHLYDSILKAGGNDIMPCGLGARDTLRFESKLMLYGHELDDETTPIEAGIAWTVKLNKPSFIGKQILSEQKEKGTKKILTGLEMIDKGVPRAHYDVYHAGGKVGYVTTGAQSPTLKKFIALAYVPPELSKLDSVVEIKIRDKFLKAKVVSLPFYKREKK